MIYVQCTIAWVAARALDAPEGSEQSRAQQAGLGGVKSQTHTLFANRAWQNTGYDQHLLPEDAASLNLYSRALLQPAHFHHCCSRPSADQA